MNIWKNGHFENYNECKVDIDSHALHYGTSVFEGCRAYRGNIFKGKEHFQRLLYSANKMGLTCPYSVEELLTATQKLLELENLQNAYIRPVIFVNKGGIGMSIHNKSIEVEIFAQSWDTYYGVDKIKQGISLGKTPFTRFHPNSIPVQAKIGGLYCMGASIQTEAILAGYNDVLMLDYEGYVAECSAANIFFIKNKEIHTPLADRFLNGITRQAIIQITQNHDFALIERRIKPEELDQFDECFVTGTAVEVMPVSSIYDKFSYSVDLSFQIREMYINEVNS